jgi:hypothetical protein
MEDSVMAWTLKGLPQRIELHTGGAAEAAAWAREKGGGVTVTGRRTMYAFHQTPCD